MSLTEEDIHDLKESPEYREAFDIALDVHRKEHEPNASHFRNCVECKSGFAILFCAGLEKLRPST